MKDLKNGVTLNNITYADDALVFANSLQVPQVLMSNIAKVSQLYSLQLHVK